VQGRATKHTQLRNPDTLSFKSDSQRQISLNKISKR
ncbi:MAG: RNA methyltransferase, partial [Bacteroidota bacterium]|nr:RNA methyltransferase [Bacteroidota bacterium]